jgi:hypothetical protein
VCLSGERGDAAVDSGLDSWCEKPYQEAFAFVDGTHQLCKIYLLYTKSKIRRSKIETLR